MTNILEQYRNNGYFHFESFFDKDEVARVKHDAQDVFLRQLRNQGIISSTNIPEREYEDAMRIFFERDTAGFISTGKTCQHLISLHRLALSEKLVAMLRDFGLEAPNICTRPVLYFNSKHLAKSDVYYKTPAHQDWRSMQGSLNAMVVWVPLIDVDIPLGALEIVPGSHLRGLLNSEQDEWFRRLSGTEADNFVPVEVKQGDALFFSAFLIHRSGDNVTDSIRWSCHFRYNDLAEQSFIDRKYPNPYTYAPQQELVTKDFPPQTLLRNYFGSDSAEAAVPVRQTL